MALTELDPLPALIVIDLQKGIIGTPYNASVSAVVEHSAALIKAFRQRHLPVVLVNVAGMPPGRRDDRRSLPDTLPEGFTDFIKEIAPATFRYYRDQIQLGSLLHNRAGIPSEISRRNPGHHNRCSNRYRGGSHGTAGLGLRFQCGVAR
ncbi:isochorismatase family protein [Kosakonia radicincitans YD4]|nr:isochorismatase family protein [Kosakonia radicincitans YD4]